MKENGIFRKGEELDRKGWDLREGYFEDNGVDGKRGSIWKK